MKRLPNTIGLQTFPKTKFRDSGIMTALRGEHLLKPASQDKMKNPGAEPTAPTPKQT